MKTRLIGFRSLSSLAAGLAVAFLAIHAAGDWSEQEKQGKYVVSVDGVEAGLFEQLDVRQADDGTTHVLLRSGIVTTVLQDWLDSVKGGQDEARSLSVHLFDVGSGPGKGYRTAVCKIPLVPVPSNQLKSQTYS